MNTKNELKEANNAQDYSYDFCTVTPIELIGYAKNDIIDDKNTVEKLPTEYDRKLKQAYDLLDDVQNYLYES